MILLYPQLASYSYPTLIYAIIHLFEHNCWYFFDKRTHTLILNVGVFALLQRCLERLKNGRQKFVDRFRRNSSSDESLVVKEVMDEEWMRLSEENLELPQWRPRRETSTPFSGVSISLVGIFIVLKES